MKRSYKLVLAALIAIALLTSCDFAMPKAEKPTVRLVSLALDYKIIGGGDLEATLPDQKAVSQQFAYLAEKSGYEFEEYKFTQTGAEEVILYLGTKDALDPDKVEVEIYLDVDEDGNVTSINTEKTDIKSWKNEVKGPKFNINDTTTYVLLNNADLQSQVVGDHVLYTIYLNDDATPTVNGTFSSAGENNKYIISALQKLGFMFGMKNTVLSSFDQISNDAKPGDLTVFYYSGHGSPKNGIEFNGALALGIDEEISPYDLKIKIAPIEGNKLIVLDSCYSGAYPLYFELFEKPYTFSDSLDTMLSIEVPTETNTWVISASRNFETSGDGGAGNCGLFTGNFLEALGAKMGDPIPPDTVPEDQKEEFVEKQKQYGIKSFEEPGLPKGKNSIWLSELLNSARNALNPLGIIGTQEPTGDNYVDLQLFKWK